MVLPPAPPPGVLVPLRYPPSFSPGEYNGCIGPSVTSETTDRAYVERTVPGAGESCPGVGVNPEDDVY